MLIVPAVLALGAVAGLADIAGGERLDRAARHLHPVWLILCLGGELLAYAGYVLMVRDTSKVDDGPSLSFGRSLQTVVGGFGVFAATRTTGGFAVDYWALRSAGEDRDGAVARVLALGALEYAVLAPAALCSAIAILVERRGRAADADAALAARDPGRVRRGLGDLAQARAALLESREAAAGSARRSRTPSRGSRSCARCSSRRRASTGSALLGTAAYWAGDIACLWGALQVFGNPRLSVPALIIGYATGYVLTRRSLPAGGAGIVEIALTFALTWVGFPFVRALLGVVVYRLFNLWLPILPALAVLPQVNELRRELEEAEAVASASGRPS